MTDAPKTRAQILADPQAFEAAYARARALFTTFPGVVGVGIGQKHQAGRYHDNIAILVYVREKKAEDEVSPAERIPPTFEGYPTDVQVVPTAGPLACDNDAVYTRIQGGIRISQNASVTPGSPPTASVEFGTLGCIVKKRNDSGRENVYLLSNMHVLFKLGVSRAGDYAFHPYPPPPPDQGGFSFPTGLSKSLGPIQPAAFFANESFPIPDPAHPGATIPTPYFIDCALVRLDLDGTCCGSTCTQDDTKYDPMIIDLQVNGVNTVADVNDVRFGPSSLAIINQQVFKVGRTSGRTVGIVRAINGSVNVPAQPNLGTPALTCLNMVQIDFDTTVAPLNCKNRAWFAEHGDSGSLIVDAQGRAIALLAIGPILAPPPAPNPPAPSFGCHIVPVLDILNICIECATGTSHGSSRATDASGVAPAATNPADSTLPSGQIVFTSAPAPASLPAVTRMPLSDVEEGRMRSHLDAFLATPRGPELREAFAQVRREVGYLVRNAKPVTVAWHKHRGPAFLAHVLNHLAGHTTSVPRDVDGITRRALVLRMREVLHKYGSHPLQHALDTYGDDILAMSEHCDTVSACIDWLDVRERV
jgi:hypothetical protein